ncbi:DNA-3-methyladenine glycosylase family protein [Sulfuriflexus mobilis]|uniref:DNA-3-methyladenine glycosylase family protein n=1 Tax=Sulfuriflexus mobilis TaxID=1811807 RepID=UPI000F81E518|nr:DNA-3-methyladenine glycosylase [Sulfuriflexus mobilis]
MDKSLLNTAICHLRKTDTVMAKIIKYGEPLTLTTTRKPYYHSLVRAIINQQLSVKAGKTIEKRILDKHGGRYFKAERVLKLKDTTLRECGISYNKINYIHTLSRAVTEGKLNFRKLVKQEDEAIRDTLMQYPGIGQWSADVFLIASLQRLDVFPVGDLVLRKSMQHHYQLAADTRHDKYVSIASAWQPYRTIASFYLWQASK